MQALLGQADTPQHMLVADHDNFPKDPQPMPRRNAKERPCAQEHSGSSDDQVIPFSSFCIASHLFKYMNI